jgi:1-acyl-sn-glycerol-3-phosphate acyltransferase
MSPHSTNTVIASSSADDGRARAWIRLPLLAVGIFMGLAIWGAGALATLPLPRARRALRRQVFHRLARFVAWLLGVRIEVEGELPARPFLLVSNHLSYLDVVVYAAMTPIRFVTKQEVRDWPVFGLLARSMGSIFVDRAAKRDALRALDELAGAMAAGDGVLLFAEATSTAGRSVLPFRPALLEWAAQTGHPAHYASIGYRTPAGCPPAHLAVCWWGDMTFLRHLSELAQLPWIEATVRHGDAPIAERDRKRLADRLHQAVSAQFTPVVAE